MLVSSENLFEQHNHKGKIAVSLEARKQYQEFLQGGLTFINKIIEEKFPKAIADDQNLTN